MTTLVATQMAHVFFSMSNKPGRRRSKRLAVAADFELDDDFEFVRKSMQAKTQESARSNTTRRSRPAAEPDAKTSIAIAVSPTAATKSLSIPTATTPGAPESSRRKVTDVPRDGETTTIGRPTRRSPREVATRRKELVEGSRSNGVSKAKSSNREKATKPVRRWEPSPTPERPTESKIALPTSDTPIINRNKEMREEGRKGNRRSSLGTRGRRASSLIESGQTAIPHYDVDPAEFHKHIEAKGLTEPKRMMQLLMWCGERALLPNPSHGVPTSIAMLGARAIHHQILKDFADRSERLNWFSRDEDAPKQPAILKPNPRNIEMDEKLAILETKIKKLQEEKQAWLAICQPPSDIPPIFPPNETPKIELPDFNVLEPEEVKIRNYLADELIPFTTIRTQTEERIRKIQGSLEFEADQLADNVHKLEQRVLVAGRQADKVLILSAQRLKERKQKEKKSAGTTNMPVMEVLRSLSNILPEGNG